MSYRYLDNIATADCAVEVTADSVEGIFRDSAKALIGRMVNLDSISATRSWTVELEDETLEGLLYDWLSELIYLKDTENVLFCEFVVDSLTDAPPYRLAARVGGEDIDQDRHDIGIEVKAVTLHMFRIEKTGDMWTAFMIFDL
jgi:SHS2 domain-containing protein